MSIISDRIYRELVQTSECKPHPTSPYDVQTYIYEILENHFLTQTQEDLGFASKKTYNRDYKKSDISLSIGHSLKIQTPDKVPAVYIVRGDARINAFGSIGGRIGNNVVEGTKDKAAHVSLPISLLIIEVDAAVTEKFAEYVTYPFLYFNTEIGREYNFQKMSVVNISSPQPIDKDQKESFAIQVDLNIDYYQTWRVKGDYLRLKTVHIEADVSD